MVAPAAIKERIPYGYQGANIGHFLFPLRGYGTVLYNPILISGKRNFSVAVRHTQPHAQQPKPYEVIMKDKCAVT
jgi:hypothetical protein